MEEHKKSFGSHFKHSDIIMITGDSIEVKRSDKGKKEEKNDSETDNHEFDSTGNKKECDMADFFEG